MKPGFVLAGFVDEHEELHILQIIAGAEGFARERGWMVWTDFERALSAGAAESP